MRKLSLVMAAMLMFTVAVWAQDSGGGQYGQTGQSTTSNKVKGEKTVEGCIVSSGTDFFLQPKHGKMIRLTDQGADLQSHVNHRVKVHGAEQTAGMAGNGTAASNPSASSTQTAASSPSSATNPDQATAANQPGAQSGNLPQSGAAGTASSTNIDRNNVSNKEITVTRVDMVSETCPADWMNKANKSDKNKTNSSSDMNNPH